MRSQVEFKPIGQLKDDYQMVRKLGHGGFSSVYLVRCRKRGMFCAAKYQKMREKSSLEDRWTARKEISLLAKLKNTPLILNLLDFYEDPHQSVIVSEYMEGDDLFEVISQKAYELTEQKCRLFMTQIIEGVEFIHKNRIIHLDIKPNNIMFNSRDDENFNLKIIDFGLARELGGMNKIKCNMCGTMEFMSPEVMNCTYASPASDMWSVGVLIFMLVSGGLSPFWGGNDYRTQRQVVRGNYSMDLEPFKEVSEEAKDLIKKLLVVTPVKRLSAKAAMDHPWLSGKNTSNKFQQFVETSQMRKYRTRLRWHNAFNVAKAIARMRKLSEQKGEKDFYPVDPLEEIFLQQTEKILS